jgi:hypothetical protein
MRKLLIAALAGAGALGGAMAAQTAHAQPGYHYDDYGRPYFDNGAYARGYYDYDRLGVPYDRFGPDPNGLIARDGHRIKCKLTDDWSYRLDRYVTRRVCD